MVAFRVGGIALASIEDREFSRVIEAAEAAGGATRFPALYALLAPNAETEPFAMMDELARLSGTEHGQQVGVSIGTLRDDLMAAVAAADEG